MSIITEKSDVEHTMIGVKRTHTEADTNGIFEDNR
jgi:hypothetical protein